MANTQANTLRRITSLLAGSAAVMVLAAAAQAASMTIPAGSTIIVRMADSVDSNRSHAGEAFRATVDSPLTVDGKIVLPAGSEAIGRLTAVEQAGRFRGRATVTMELTAINFDGKSVSVLTATHQESSSPRGKKTAFYAGGGTATGALVGGIAGGPIGMVVGATVGAAGGAVVEAVRGPQQVHVPAESLMLFTLLSPITVEAQQ